MTNRIRTKLLTLILLLFSILMGDAYAQEIELSHRASPLKNPVPSVDFSLIDTDENMHKFSDLRGKVAVVNFWAVWCPPCREEMPSLERLRRKLAGKPAAVLAINQGEDAERILSYLWGLDPVPEFPILLDQDMKVSSEWAVTGLPTTYIIDKQGNIVYRMIGGREFDHPEIVKVIEKLLAE
ncbi:MAG: TlpA disulfide reductase family protein [Pseudomonadota bacterium]|nr:TlpA disulfide reductase family protein [Pseudomonadota bacterium]